MAFMRYAKAMVVQPHVTQRGWGKVRKTASTPARSLVAQASEILGTTFDPSKYLLTHCTIVASVDVEKAPGVKLGRVKVGSKTINRKYADYLIQPQCSQYVNNNGDSWSREVLLMSYRTFIGAQNFLEHVQIEEQSKGRIIDAVARDIGDSVYIDILVATDRRHTQLVKDILSGKMGTLSMGCFIAGTRVTMADGTRVPIEDVQVGDMVLTHKGRAREVLNKQIRGVQNGHWDIRRIRAQGVPNEIVATDIHPFFVFRAADVCACGCGEALPEYTPSKGGLHHKYTTRRMSRRFKRGHDKRILNPNGSYSLEEYREREAHLEEIRSLKMEEVKAADLSVGDFLCFPRAAVEQVGGGATTGRARLLGYFLAEGSFLKYKGDPVEVQFNFSMSEKDTYVAEVVDLLRREFPEANVPWVQERPERNTCVVHISGRDVAAWFYTHGGEYSHRKRMSAEVMAWPAEMHHHVVGAWINGDGHLHCIHGSTSGTTTSYDLACQMHMLMAHIGVYTRMECNVAGRSVDVRQVINGGVVVRDDATGKLPAFTLVAGQTDAQPLAGYSDKVIGDPTYANRALRVLDDVVMFPITSIEHDTYEGWVYDMEVEEDHSYVVEGVAVHNCSVSETVCTQCGNVAVDETELCDHIRYAKLNTYYDDSGNKRVIAELCGHPSLGDTGGVNFIEASWVATPAFTGAVLRNILEPSEVSPAIARQASEVLSQLPAQWAHDDAMVKAANMAGTPVVVGKVSDRRFQAWGDEEEGESSKEDAPAKSPLDTAEEDLYKALTDRVKKRVLEDLQKKEVQESLNDTESTGWQNDSVVKEGYRTAVQALTKKASSDVDFVNRLATLNRAFGIEIPVDLYRASLRVGSYNSYSSPDMFRRACERSLGRSITPAELRVFLRVGKLLTRLGSNNNSRQ